ncbi:transcriptional regulator [Mangrovibacter phragmitis]|uniref:Transcriptional regulator n=1 Tax=Mangrovibacter phragmitis TaxID=1691903 RepID=A0A1B7L8T2_9ENTR|nr:helix-turn-helix domain-containing protein [Mangrovibacter phragmitis]OAT78706.1 transcriptional regulator [Mangrovibacter phragmitis]
MALQHDVIHLIMSWIDENIDKPLKIDDVARRSGYSRWHLQRLFYQETRQTLASYIRDRKLEYAANDLKDPEQSILEISFRYGFDSQQSFTRTFSRKYHMPPGSWRKKYQYHSQE